MNSNLKLSPEQLDTIELLGKDFLEISEIAISIGVTKEQLERALKDQEHEAHKRYFAGRLPEKVKHIRNLKELSNRGSSPAQAMVDKYIQKSEPF